MQAVKTLAAIFVPWFYSSRGGAFGCGGKRTIYMAIYGVLFTGWLVLLIASVGQRGIAMIGWIMYVAYALHTAYARAATRTRRNIRGDVLSDMLICMIFYPFAAVQMHDEAIAFEEEKSPSDSGHAA